MIHPRLCNAKLNFYPRSPCGERRAVKRKGQADQGISIHALLAESDGGFVVGSWRLVIFLSTLSLRRATWSSPRATMRTWKFLSTLSLRRATNSAYGALDGASISIHALLAESDIFPVLPGYKSFRFLSTLSLRRATSGYFRFSRLDAISIHALLAESDLQQAITAEQTARISIHALLAESDTGLLRRLLTSTISIHALLAESDTRHGSCRRRLSISIHALLAESDAFSTFLQIRVALFLSTLSLRRATLHFGTPRR